MKINTTQMIVGGIAISIFAYWIYNRYRSKKAIEKVKDDELVINTSKQPEIPKMFIKAGSNIPAGAMSFIDDQKY